MDEPGEGAEPLQDQDEEEEHEEDVQIPGWKQ
jgi:hypothetical protein